MNRDRACRTTVISLPIDTVKKIQCRLFGATSE